MIHLPSCVCGVSTINASNFNRLSVVKSWGSGITMRQRAVFWRCVGIVKPQWTKSHLAKCAISLKEAIFLIKQAQIDKNSTVTKLLCFFGGGYLSMWNILFSYSASQYWLVGRGSDLYKFRVCNRSSWDGHEAVLYATALPKKTRTYYTYANVECWLLNTDCYMHAAQT